jgi:hypothetical protein
MHEVLEIIPPALPFGLDDKIFYDCTEDCEENCECSKNPQSFNDFKKRIEDISGVNPELMGKF